MTELKPCPFCGRNVKFEYFGVGGAIVCIHCDIFVGTQVGEIENVISVWNKRVALQQSMTRGANTRSDLMTDDDFNTYYEIDLDIFNPAYKFSALKVRPYKRVTQEEIEKEQNRLDDVKRKIEALGLDWWDVYIVARKESGED